ncbi:MAG: NTP transferase domain-containing protein [Planctomycetes bacterium]|nr:NTP transferase domain-containing protein [Planctomycetota bacterium]
MSTDERAHLWAVVLAGGEGTRLSRLTRALYGFDIPKQFARLGDERSLLQQTMDRIAPLFPLRRTVVVAGRNHEFLARRQLRAYPGIDLALQPRNLDTGPGLLFPLSRILVRDPDARVVFFPADHHVRHAGPFLDAVGDAVGSADLAPSGVALLGVEPEEPETEYGWILPGEGLVPGGASPSRAVRGFVEKPGRDAAVRLQREGALWNTFVSAGRGVAFWELALRFLPDQAAAFTAHLDRTGGSDVRAELEALYGRMNPANFSRAVLERAEGLAVQPVVGSGWRDWGSPDRVFRSLAGTPALRRLLDRLSRRSETAEWLPAALPA